MLLLVLFSFLFVVHSAISQFTTSLTGRCDHQTAYFYGTCRVRTCFANETLLQGSSFCDVYRVYLRTPFVRCAATLPCCLWGGQCRQQCSTGENQLAVQNNCTVTRRGVCCAPPNTGTNVSQGGIPPAQVPVTQRQTQCGTRTAVRGRNVGGGVAQPTRWPWMVRLVFQGNAPAACAGVLVDNDTVVTVAHCVARDSPVVKLVENPALHTKHGDVTWAPGVTGFDLVDCMQEDLTVKELPPLLCSSGPTVAKTQETPANQLQVRIGAFDLTRTDPEEEVVGVRNIEVNRNFVAGTRGNDFAVLRLARPINITQNILPVCLPDPRTQLFRPLQCFVAGWGVTQTGQVNTQLRAASVRFMDPRLCNVMITSASPNSTSLGTDMICTEALRNNLGTNCLFDDGGMLSCLDTNNRFILVGLVAEFSCGTLPTVYTRLDNHTDAILSRL